MRIGLRHRKSWSIPLAWNNIVPRYIFRLMVSALRRKTRRNRLLSDSTAYETADIRVRTRAGAWIMAIAGLIAFIVCLADYLTPHGAIAQAWGTLLVVVSTGLMLIAGGLLALIAMPRWLVVLFEVLLILDIVGTGFCADMLEAPAVLVLMLLALIGWVVHLAVDAPHIAR